MKAPKPLAPGECARMTALMCRCARCKHAWYCVPGVGPKRPARCPLCGARTWSQATPRKAGRPLGAKDNQPRRRNDANVEYNALVGAENARLRAAYEDAGLPVPQYASDAVYINALRRGIAAAFVELGEVPDERAMLLLRRMLEADKEGA